MSNCGVHQYVANRNVFRDCLKLSPPIIGSLRQGIPDRRTSQYHYAIITARCVCISAIYAVTRCPSVRLSVAFMSCAKTNEDIFEIFSSTW